MAPDYSGYGSSWGSATYHGLPVTVPEILHKLAGPRSVVRQRRYPAFSGMGDPVYTSPDANYSVDVSAPYYVGIPEDILWQGPIQPQGPELPKDEFPWWLLIAAGLIYGMSNTSGNKRRSRLWI